MNPFKIKRVESAVEVGMRDKAHTRTSHLFLSFGAGLPDHGDIRVQSTRYNDRRWAKPKIYISADGLTVKEATEFNSAMTYAIGEAAAMERRTWVPDETK